jgi:hypothetical protein
MATCRFCGKGDARDKMLNYSTRANAHAECVLNRPDKDFARFIGQVTNLSNFPILRIKDDVDKLEALRDAYRNRNYPEAYAEICEDMIKQRLEDLVDARRKSDRWSD